MLVIGLRKIKVIYIELKMNSEINGEWEKINIIGLIDG